MRSPDSGRRGVWKRSRPVRGWAAIVAASLTVAACGLTPGAVTAIKSGSLSAGGRAAGSGGGVTGGGGGAGAGVSPGGVPLPGSAVAGSSGSLPVGASGVPASGGGGGDAGTGGVAGGGSGGGGGTTAGGGASNAPYERIGITATTIHLGLHAPQTGAAPVPLQAFAKGTKLFWENHTLFGRQVVVDFADDQYNPSVARGVCEQLSRSDFLVLGGAGTDQIQACATDPTLATTHTPYLSAGVTTNGLDSLSNYFAITQAYAAQSPEVWTMTNQLYGADAHKSWAIITEQTPNFNDVTTSMQQVLSQNHVSSTTIRSPKVFQQSDADAAISRAKQAGAGVVFLDVDPNFWIDLVRSASQQLYTPDWVGPGITNGEDLVAAPVCGEQPSIKAAFLSPYPGLDKAPPGFASESNPAPDADPPDRDIEMLVYGTNEAEYNMLNSLGNINNLTRDNFLSAAPKFTASYGSALDVLPTINFKGGHFGGTGMWALKLNCSQAEYVTVGSAPISS